MRHALARFIRWVCRDVRYHAHYPCTVEFVHADESVDVTPDDDAIRGAGLSGLRPAPGLPDTGIVPVRGTRCLVGFKRGDPRAGFVSSWESGPGTSELVRLTNGGAGLARSGDLLEVTFPDPNVVSALLNGFVQPPGAPPPPPVLVANLPFEGAVTIPPDSVSAVIDSGNPDLLA